MLMERAIGIEREEGQIHFPDILLYSHIISLIMRDDKGKEFGLRHQTSRCSYDILPHLAITFPLPI